MIATLPYDIQLIVSSFYASPERTAVEVCDIRGAVRIFNRQRIKKIARYEMDQRLRERLRQLSCCKNGK